MGALTSIGRLMEMIASGEDVTVLDVRWSLGGPPGKADFEAGHIPGATFVDLEADLAGPPGGGGRHPLPDPDHFAQAMRAAGVRRLRPVVVYDQRDGIAAARAWWLLVHHGHDAVRVLDGGFDAWCAAGGSVETGGSQLVPGDFVAQPGRLPTLTAQEARRVAASGLLLDVRTNERYLGEHEPVDLVAGHIPGAVNAPADGNLTPEGSWQPQAGLRARFAELGVDGTQAVGVYCGSGVTATHTVLALHEAGYEAALYPGSWSEWITDPRREVATGR